MNTMKNNVFEKIRKHKVGYIGDYTDRSYYNYHGLWYRASTRSSLTLTHRVVTPVRYVSCNGMPRMIDPESLTMSEYINILCGEMNNVTFIWFSRRKARLSKYVRYDNTELPY